MLEEGTKAPVFHAKDQLGKYHKLSDYKGKWLLLYFYPKNFTPGCTKEACEFRDNFSNLKKKITIIGISKDSVESHQKFENKYHLPFTLLSDPKRNIISKYGVAAGPFTRRVSYIIGPDGTIKKVYKKVDPKIHAAQILKDLEYLQEE